MLKSIWVWLFGVWLVVVKGRKGEVELIIVVVGSDALQFKFVGKYISCYFKREVM